MKHKTLFRLLLKLIGVWVFVGGLNNLFTQLGYLGYLLTNPAGMRQEWYMLIGLLGIFAQMGVGAYLFFGGRWIADLAIPSNRPYCHECGYDLTNAAGHVCTECGTPFKAEVIPAP